MLTVKKQENAITSEIQSCNALYGLNIAETRNFSQTTWNQRKRFFWNSKQRKTYQEERNAEALKL